MGIFTHETRGPKQSGKMHAKSPGDILFKVLVMILRPAKCGLTFQERSIPALQWTLWRCEQTLETELQSLAHIHPSHLKEKCK